MLTNLILLLVISGLLGGILAGLLGIGGGVIFVIVLPFAFNFIGVDNAVSAQLIVANSLVATFFSSLSASVALYRRKMFYIKPVAIIGLSSILSSALVLKYLVGTARFNLLLLNIVLLAMLAYMLVRAILIARNTAKAEALADQKFMGIGTWRCIGLGILMGIIAPLSGLGGGIILVPLLTGWVRLPTKYANAISLGAIGITSFSASIQNLFIQPLRPITELNIGLIVPVIAFSLSLGVIVGSPLGVKLSSTLTPKTISNLFAIFLVIIIVRKIFEIFAQLHLNWHF